MSVITVRGEFLKQDAPSKRRRELEAKMSKVSEGHVKMLSKGMQEILIDDLVTAFQNRIDVLNRARDWLKKDLSHLRTEHNHVELNTPVPQVLVHKNMPITRAS